MKTLAQNEYTGLEGGHWLKIRTLAQKEGTGSKSGPWLRRRTLAWKKDVGSEGGHLLRRRTLAQMKTLAQNSPSASQSNPNGMTWLDRFRSRAGLVGRPYG